MYKIYWSQNWYQNFIRFISLNQYQKTHRFFLMLQIFWTFAERDGKSPIVCEIFSPFVKYYFCFIWDSTEDSTSSSLWWNKDLTRNSRYSREAPRRATHCNLLISCWAYRCYPPDGCIAKRQSPCRAATTTFVFLFQRSFAPPSRC